MSRRKLKADLLAELLYYRSVFDEEELKHAKLSIKIHYNGNHLPLNKSPEFYRMYDFCANRLIPHAEKCSLLYIMTRRVD